MTTHKYSRPSGTVALVLASWDYGQPVTRSGGGTEQGIDEFDLAGDAWLLVMNVTSLDGPDCLNATWGRFRWSQGSKALSIAKQSLYGGVIALDQVVPPFSVDVPDAVKMWVVSMIDLADDTPIALRLIGHDRH